MDNWNINSSELDSLIKTFEKAGNSIDSISQKAVEVGVLTVKSEMSKRIPRSIKHRPKEKGIQTWRNDKHAADDISISELTISIRGNRYRVVGPKNDDDPHFYIKFFETGKINIAGWKKKGDRLTTKQIKDWGTSYQPPRPFIEKAKAAVEAKVIEQMKQVILQEMGLND